MRFFVYLQTLFILFVNSQGIFIFFFYCARNGEIRAGWRRLWHSTTGGRYVSVEGTQLSHVKSVDTASSIVTKMRTSDENVTTKKRNTITPVN